MERRASIAVYVWAAVGTAIAVAWCLVDLNATHDTLGGLVATGPGPASPVFLTDFPDEPLAPGGAHDGAFYYVLAREPMHLADAAQHTDRPRYRAQRILFPVLAWMLHPTGGGPGLVWAMFAVGVAGIMLGGVATGKMSVLLRGPPFLAVFFGAMLGSWVCLRISTSDALALALTIFAMYLSMRGWRWTALAVAVAAVLTKETSLLTLVAFAMWRRDREGVELVVGPAAIAGLWWLWLKAQLGGPASVVEFGAPFGGWVGSVRFWLNGNEPLGLVAAAIGVAAAVGAIVVARPSHPLWWAVVLNLALTVFLVVDPLGPERNATRVFLPMQVLGFVTIATRSWRGRPADLLAAPIAARDAAVPATT